MAFYACIDWLVVTSTVRTINSLCNFRSSYIVNNQGACIELRYEMNCTFFSLGGQTFEALHVCRVSAFVRAYFFLLLDFGLILRIFAPFYQAVNAHSPFIMGTF